MTSDRYTAKLERAIRQQLSSQNVGYLLGAGASYLDGNGYPLANDLWEMIKAGIQERERNEIQAKLDLKGTKGLEHALDLLDPGGPKPTAHRLVVTNAIADLFSGITPTTDAHREFIKRISKRDDHFVPIFTLNYDPLVEYAADQNKIAIVDGYSGVYQPTFYHNCFDLVPSEYDFRKNNRMLRGKRGVIHLYKLHGSVGWFIFDGNPIRVNPDKEMEVGWHRLMIPPQYRKAFETTTQPYSSLWTRFRAWLIHGPETLNRLVCNGYGMGDQHVNDVIESAVGRYDFTLLIFAKSLQEPMLAYWGAKQNTIVVTEEKCFMFGEEGPGHPNLWDFQVLCQEV